VAAITYATLKARVALNCNNLPTSDPHYTYLGDVVNQAANDIILMAVSKDRRNINLFRNLRDRRYYDITVNNQGYLSRPSTLLVVDSVTCTRDTDSYDPSRSTEYPVTEEPDQATFALLDKSTSTTGWPTIWTEAAEQILLWPTPVTAYLTQVVVRGIRKEAALSNDNDTFTMEDIWHPIVLMYATHLMKLELGDPDADNWLEKAEKRVTQTVDILGLQNRRNRMRVQIAGAL
jgi:hypothetical protein